MRVGNYEIMVVCTTKRRFAESLVCEDVYTDYNEFREEHPNSPIKFGFYCNRTDGASIDDPDWFDTIDEAIQYALNN